MFYSQELISRPRLAIISVLVFSMAIEDPHGDQALMMTRKMYDRVGGFDPVLLMEDYMLVSCGSSLLEAFFNMTKYVLFSLAGASPLTFVTLKK